MKRRIWTSKQKSQIVLEGLSGQIDVNTLCQKYQISQTQYYKWRDLFLANCHQSFEVKKQTYQRAAPGIPGQETPLYHRRSDD